MTGDLQEQASFPLCYVIDIGFLTSQEGWKEDGFLSQKICVQALTSIRPGITPYIRIKLTFSLFLFIYFLYLSSLFTFTLCPCNTPTKYIN